MIPSGALYTAPVVPIHSAMDHTPSSSSQPSSSIEESREFHTNSAAPGSLYPSFTNPFAASPALSLRAFSDNTNATMWRPHPLSGVASNAHDMFSTQTPVHGLSQPGSSSFGRGGMQRQSFDLCMLPITSQQQHNFQLHATPTPTPTAATSAGAPALAPAAPLATVKVEEVASPVDPSSPTSNNDNDAAAPVTAEAAIAATAGSNLSDIALLLSGAISIKPGTTGKPPYSYATLITFAILQNPRKQMTLSEIYSWVMGQYSYFETAGTGWKNSIRHNLSLNKTFVRIPRPVNEPGKGAYWTVDLAVLEETMHNRPKPPPHRYSLPHITLDGPEAGSRAAGMSSMGSSSLSAGAMPMGASGGFQMGLAPQQQQNQFSGDQHGFSASRSLMMGMASRVGGDFDMMPRLSPASSSLAPGGAHALRRASLQISPIHRYQPYSMAGMPPLPPPPHYNISSNHMQAHHPHMFNMISSFTTPIMAPLQPPSSIRSHAASRTAHTIQPATIQPHLHGGISSAGFLGINNSAGADPASQSATPLSADTASASSRSNTATNKQMEQLSLQSHLLVKPTPSLPEYLLAPHQDVANIVKQKQYQTASPESRSVGKLAESVGTKIYTNNMVEKGHYEAENAGDDSQMARRQKAQDGEFGDISTYFTFGDAAESKPSDPSDTN
ncbi:hypothetical protein LPJ66_002789 [Kickxella alabastrina]|uniref:Uncharacterized protein n=1 Tax=Kickxella alabastrina TaxID=61397 RepID=A0ACC1IPH4_9FUNG|nr:hypothetical protein LPJ66_002789 [Kickxella alabastrina]